MEQMGSMWELALTTAAVGMSVVFAALFLLSCYMNVFKRVLSDFEKKKAQPKKKTTPAAAPKLAPAPAVATKTGGEDEARAAAIGLSLHMSGVRGEVSADVAAAIGMVLCLEGIGAPSGALTDSGAGTSWSMAGRFDAQALRGDRRGWNPVAPNPVIAPKKRATRAKKS